MTDEYTIEWHESDRNFVDMETDVVKLANLLYSFDCKDCGRSLTLELDPDPDSLRYRAECDNCELRYSFNVTHVEGTVSDASL